MNTKHPKWQAAAKNFMEIQQAFDKANQEKSRIFWLCFANLVIEKTPRTGENLQALITYGIRKGWPVDCIEALNNSFTNFYTVDRDLIKGPCVSTLALVQPEINRNIEEYKTQPPHIPKEYPTPTLSRRNEDDERIRSSCSIS